MSLDLTSLLFQISDLDRQLTNRAAKSIDRLLTLRNWLIGGYIFEFEQNGAVKAIYGTKLEQTLAERLNRKGLSERNLKLFKQFYLAYPQIMQTVSAQFKLPKNILQPTSASSAGANEYTTKLLDNISFSHFTELLKISSKEKREFYEIQCIKGIWTVRELKRQINSLTFERTAAS